MNRQSRDSIVKIHTLGRQIGELSHLEILPKEWGVWAPH